MVIYTSLFARKAAATSGKKAPNTQQKQTKERENYAQIGRASEQCYHQRTLKTSVNQR